MLSFSCTVLGTWEGSFIAIFSYGFPNGGPAGTIYGFIIVWVGTLARFACLSELASMAPTASGQYHWVAMLAPRSSQRLLSYLTGWLTVCGWVGTAASATGFTASLVQGLVKLTHTDYDIVVWQLVLIYWAIVLFAVGVNAFAGWLLPVFEGIMLFIHVLGFFAILIPLLVLGKYQSTSQVFETWINQGNWSSQGLSFLVGIIGSVYAFIGADAAFHMAEEIENAPIMVPRSVLFSVILNGTLGFATVIASQFVVSDIEEVLSSPTGFPSYGLFLQATRSAAGAATMAAIIVTLSITTVAGVFASASRMVWSFSRDKGVPGWRFVSKIDARTSVPLWALAVVSITAALLALINFGSTVALNALVTIGVAGLYFSYLIAASLLLFRRVAGSISEPGEESADIEVKNTIGYRLEWGPWRIKGIFGILVNMFACAYMILILFFSFWPPATPVTASSMNYSSAVFGGVIIFSLVYYYLWSHREYKGPIVEMWKSPSGAG